MNIEILNWWGHHEKGARGGVKRTRGDEPTGVSISNQQKTPCFSFIFYVFFFCRIGEQEGRTGSAWGGVEWQQWEGEVGKEVRG
jgi:hypothetical protein